MGQKTNPISLRLQTTNRNFDSCWYSDFFYPEFIIQNLKIQDYLNSIFKQIQYPGGRFFIESSQKKVKIFIFFCSPTKSRKIRSNFFKIKYHKNLKKNKIVNFLDKPQIQLNHFTEKKILLLNQKQQEKITYLKYLVYSMYLQNVYSSNFPSLFTNSRKINVYSLPFSFFTEQKQENTFLHTEINKTLQIKDSSLPYEIDANYLLVKKKIKKSQIFFNNILKKKRNAKKPNSLVLDNSLVVNLRSHINTNLALFYSFFNSGFFLESLHRAEKRKYYTNENSLKLYNIFNKLTYRKHLETILKQQLQLKTNLYFLKLQDPFRSALFLAEEIVYYLERRIPFRRIKNRILKEVQHLSFIKGIRIVCSGRVGGRSKKAQRAKTESFKYGQTSLHVFSSRIDFASKKALTTFGLIGIKVWVSYND